MKKARILSFFLAILMLCSAVPAVNASESTSEYVIKFDNQSALDLIKDSEDTEYFLDGDSLKVRSVSGNDPGILIDLSGAKISCNDIKSIAVVYRVPPDNTYPNLAQNIYYVCNTIDAPDSRYKSNISALKKTGKYESAVFDLSSKGYWKNDLKAIRLDYFTYCNPGDYMNIDSVIFAKDKTEAKKLADVYVGKRQLDYPQGVWNYYRKNCRNNNNSTYLADDYTMYFRYADGNLTCESLAKRFADAISTAVGVDVECDIYNGYNELLSKNSAYVHYILRRGGESYIVYLKTQIIRDNGYSDRFDGINPENDPKITYARDFSNGGAAADKIQTAIPASSSGLAGHSNHENRVVDTPYGTYAVVPMSDGGDSTWGKVDGASATVYKIENGSYESLWTFTFSNHTTKPNIYYAADGNVYVCCADAGNGFGSLYVGYFNPAVKFTSAVEKRQNINFNGGNAPGGYGYGQPILDDTNGKFVFMYCGGTSAGHFAWFVYDYRNHRFETVALHTVLSDTYRTCYLYGFSDGADGLYVVGGRDVLLTTLGYQPCGADYAWDEVSIFHFPSIYDDSYTRICVNEADYSQADRMMPTTSNNAHGDAYISRDGYLHVLTSTRMHGLSNHHNTLYWEYWYSVYDVREPGAVPVPVYNEPINFTRDKSINEYGFRMVESPDGQLYIVAMGFNSPAAEIYKVNKKTRQLEYVSCTVMGDGTANKCDGSIIVANNRNGSVIDGDVTLMIPTSGGGTRYKFTQIIFDEAEIIPGDINTDGSVDAKDAYDFIMYLAGDETAVVNEKVLDTNGDKTVNIADLTHLSKYLAGLDVILY